MAILPENKPYALKDKVTRSVDAFASLDKPTKSDLNMVKVTAQIESGIEAYRAASIDMELDILKEEAHQSKRLSLFMSNACDPRPHPLCHAHAIVSGAHKYSAELRGMLAWLKVRIDDPDNGCWLPENTAAVAQMPKHLSNAVPHSRIHRFNYYFWLNQLINPFATDEQTKLRNELRMISNRLQSGRQPPYVMNKKGIGLPV